MTTAEEQREKMARALWHRYGSKLPAHGRAVLFQKYERFSPKVLVEGEFRGDLDFSRDNLFNLEDYRLYDEPLLALVRVPGESRFEGVPPFCFDRLPVDTVRRKLARLTEEVLPRDIDGLLVVTETFGTATATHLAHWLRQLQAAWKANGFVTDCVWRTSWTSASN